MLELKNGILFRDGKSEFVLGQSYFASYHPQKVPVLDDGDRIGEMKIDFQEMREAGFNLVRMAALGTVERDPSGGVNVQFPMIDQFVDYAAEVGIAPVVRLQGYSINLSGYTDALMMDEYGNDMPLKWSSFIRNCLNHPGAIKDNEEATVASAAHFKGSPVVGFQIYNEPAYPDEHVDYNPHSIRAWRKWLVAEGLKTDLEVETLNAPLRRPAGGENPSDWINWQLFKMERLNDFLNVLSDKAKEGHNLPTLTCHMPCPLSLKAAIRGESYYQVAERMDVLGITHYIPSHGPEYYNSSAVLALTECAATVYGKHAWLVEYNCKTRLGVEEYERQMYSAVGSGIKGIMLYQWRADYPFENSPEPEMFGLLWNNRTKTEKFDQVVAMNKLISRLGHYVVASERERCGVGILFSDYANAACSAQCGGHEPSIYGMRHAYAELHKAGVSVDFVRSEDLESNVFNTELLIVPVDDCFLSPVELGALDAAEKRGVQVIRYSLIMNTFGWPDGLNAEALLRSLHRPPLWQVNEPHLDAKVLRANDKSFIVIALTNTDSLSETIPAGKVLTLHLPRNGKFSKAECHTPGKTEVLSMEQHDDAFALTLPELSTGGFVIMT